MVATFCGGIKFSSSETSWYSGSIPQTMCVGFVISGSLTFRMSCVAVSLQFFILLVDPLKSKNCKESDTQDILKVWEPLFSNPWRIAHKPSALPLHHRNILQFNEVKNNYPIWFNFDCHTKSFFSRQQIILFSNYGYYITHLHLKCIIVMIIITRFSTVTSLIIFTHSTQTESRS